MDSRIVLISVLLVTGANAQTVRIAGDTGAPLPVNATASANGLPVYVANLLSGEDATNNVLKVEHQYSYSAGATSDTAVKASAGFLHAVTCGSDAAATAGSLAIRDSTSAGAGTVVFLWTFTTTEVQPRTIFLDAVFATGIYFDFTTTADVTCTASYR